MLHGVLGLHEGRIQRHYLRQLVKGPILDQLLCKIEELPRLQAAAGSSTTTFKDSTSTIYPLLIPPILVPWVQTLPDRQLALLTTQ